MAPFAYVFSDECLAQVADWVDQGYGLRDIAESMGCPASSLRVRLYPWAEEHGRATSWSVRSVPGLPPLPQTVLPRRKPVSPRRPGTVNGGHPRGCTCRACVRGREIDAEILSRRARNDWETTPWWELAGRRLATDSYGKGGPR